MKMDKRYDVAFTSAFYTKEYLLIITEKQLYGI